MKHFSCDMCGRAIREHRYLAKIEIQAMFDPEEIQESDLDVDHLDYIAEALDQLESTADFHLPETGPKKMEFDLCGGCMKTFVKSPMATKSTTNFRPNYSQN